MPRQRRHDHPCQGTRPDGSPCLVPVECGGEWEQNHDGIPEVICREFHEAGGGINFDFRCDDCEAAYWAEAKKRADDADYVLERHMADDFNLRRR